MATTAADVLVEGIIGWGVDTVFGLPGGGRIALTVFRDKLNELL
jgi:thiamine pyrophosphate-dependent acetolactate synthase large subunit-like protein